MYLSPKLGLRWPSKACTGWVDPSTTLSLLSRALVGHCASLCVASLVRGVSLQNMDSGLDGLMLTFLEAYLVNGRWVERAPHLSIFA